MKALAIFALVVGLGCPLVANAQHDEPYTDAEKWVLAEKQLVKDLASPIDAVRQQALKNAIVFSTLYRDKIDLNDTVGAICAVYENEDELAAHRTLALAALQAIGSGRAATYMIEHVPQAEAEESRTVMVAVLSEYYTARAHAL